MVFSMRCLLVFVERYLLVYWFPWLGGGMILLNLVFYSLVCAFSKVAYSIYGRSALTRAWLRNLAAHIVWWIGRVQYGYEVRGIENVPDKGPALFVAYHGLLATDSQFLSSYMYLVKKREFWGVSEKNIHKVKWYGDLFNLIGMFDGSREKCEQLLSDGQLVFVYPGGIQEALAVPCESYQLVWGNRKGFADIVLKCKVPVIPMFTENMGEAYWLITPVRRLQDYLYRSKKFSWFLLFLGLIFGGYPVKLRTWIGRPVVYDAQAISAEELALKTKMAVEALIREKQMVPGSVLTAMLQRFTN